jgi:hypothetical protein
MGYRPSNAPIIWGASLGAIVGVVGIVVGTWIVDSYGWFLFLGVPALVGVVSALPVMIEREHWTQKRVVIAATLGIFFAHFFSFFTTVEGAVCLAMAFPVTLSIALLAALVTDALALQHKAQWYSFGVGLVALQSMLGVVDHRLPTPRSTVTSTVEIAAPVEKVFALATSSIELAPPSDPILQFTGAYGVRSQAIGTGEGSYRLCQFSTGKCLQRMAIWEPNRKVEATVLISPPPIRELSFAHVHPPHLNGYTTMKKWTLEFEDLGGRTRVTRTTVYEQRMQPGWYWTFIGDQMVSRIHAHKLDWLKSASE